MQRASRPNRVGILGVVVGGLAVAAALAQDGVAPENLLQQQRAIDEQREERRKSTAPLDSFVDWQWGGWIDYYVFHFDDGFQRQRVLQRPGLAAWTRLTLDEGAHELFARVRLTFDYYNPGDQFDRQQDWRGPNFDRAWYEIDVGKAFRVNQPSDPLQMKVRIGRQEVVFGTGYAINLPLDAVLVDGKIYDFRVTGLFGKTIGSYPNVDTSEPVDSHSARRFFGVQVAYEGFDKHRPFIYAAWNDDYTDERPQDALQNYAYDTQYFGLGSRGEIVHNLNYWTEWVFETGRSYGDGDFIQRDVVEAWAWDIGVEKLWDAPMKPRVSAEYMFASGDGDRVFSPTNAAGGNRGDRLDTSFVGFGYRDTGISAGPALSNLHIWRAGGEFQPLESVELFRDLELGTNWFLYHKHHRRAAITDGGADMFAGYVGWEMDYFINWRIASDIAWTIRWGMFFPGDAFSDQSSRSFLFTGLTWSF